MHLAIQSLKLFPPMTSNLAFRLPSLVVLCCLMLSGCLMVSPYDEVTDRAITELEVKTELFFARVQGDGSGYTANRTFYQETKASLKAIRLRANAHVKNEGEVKLIDQLAENFDNLAELHKVGQLTGLAGTTAYDLIVTNFRSLIQVEIAKKRSLSMSN